MTNIQHPTQLDFFFCKGHFYKTGTRFLYSGTCIINSIPVQLERHICTFLFMEKNIVYFQVEKEIATCSLSNIDYRVIAIIDPVPKPKSPPPSEPEFFWTDEVCNNTFCYVVAMLFGFIVQNCISWWILATIIYYNCTFRKR